MKSILFFSALFLVLAVNAQEDKSKRPSPPDSVTVTLNNGAMASINYSQPSVKGRTIGTDLEPLPGKVWRTGANEATVFETDKNVKIEGKDLPAGKYGLFTIANGNNWTIIFNKTWNQWGAFDYKDADDALRVNVKSTKAKEFAERMKFQISKDGLVTLLWGDIKVNFKIE
ncbi:MAG: DUF2911 domain-containing protein [Chitinophagales bacterium]